MDDMSRYYLAQLEEAEVTFIKALDEDGNVVGVVARYQDEVIAAGKTEKEVRDGLKGVMKITDEVKLKGALDELVEIAEKERNVGKFVIKNEGEITALQFSKIADRIFKSYKVEMHLIDQYHKEFRELFTKWQGRPLDGMWVEQTLISKNYGIKLRGPGIYLFKGVSYPNGIAKTYKVTSYTVQHELFHLEFWIRLKQSYPKSYSQVFHSIPDEIHETFVLSQFVKSRKYTKWSETDMVADLEAFNKEFGKSMKLDDFINFDFDKYLKNNIK
jgi:hypothetical protein